MFERFSPEAHQVLTLARNDAVASGSSFVEPEHILLALLRSNRALARKLAPHVTEKTVELRLRELQSSTTNSAGMPPLVEFSHTAKRILAYSAGEAERNRIATTITPFYLLEGILREHECWCAQQLRRCGP